MPVHGARLHPKEQLRIIAFSRKHNQPRHSQAFPGTGGRDSWCLSYQSPSSPNDRFFRNAAFVFKGQMKSVIPSPFFLSQAMF